MLYSPLKPGHIRLLKFHPGSFNDPIRCGLVLHDLENPEEQTFDALSYTWGDASNTSSIQIKGEEFQVKEI